MGLTRVPAVCRHRNREHLLMVPGQAQGGWMLGKIRDSRVDVPRVTAAALLLMVAAVGVRARSGLSARPPWVSAASLGDFAAALGAAEALAACACLALLVVVFRGRRRRRRDNQQQLQELAPHSRLSRLLALLFVLAVLSLPIAALISHPYARHTGAASRPAPAPGATPFPATHHPGHTAAAHAPWQPGAVVAVIAAAAAVVLMLALRQGRRGRGSPAPAQEPPEASAAPLRAALADAAMALGGPAGPRQAIIASYAAMEARLAAAGAAPAAADSPAEVLARAAEAGLVRSPAAGTLTGLFRRARYSRHPLGESERAAASGALARLRADIE
jgi:hypothetical protein